MHTKAFWIALITFPAVLGGLFLLNHYSSIQKPIIITNTEYIEVEKSVPVERVVRIVQTENRTVYVDVVKEVPVIVKSQSRWFESFGDLQAWYTKTAFNITPAEDWDCDDWAIEFQQRALEDGYLLPLAPVYQGKILGVKVLDPISNDVSHVANWTLIGNDFYYIESTPVKDTFTQGTMTGRLFIKIAERD